MQWHPPTVWFPYYIVMYILWRLMPPFVVMCAPLAPFVLCHLSVQPCVVNTVAWLFAGGVGVPCVRCGSLKLFDRPSSGVGLMATFGLWLAERRLMYHDVLHTSCGSMDWSRTLVGKLAGRVGDAVVCPALQKTFVALLNGHQIPLGLARVCLQCIG